VVAQAEIWLMETPNQKRRPVLVVTRDEAIPAVNNVVVAPVTSTVRDIPTCIPVGPDEGLDHDSVASFDNLAMVPKSVLTLQLGALGAGGRRQICDALAALANC
jgi:mRNA interferase MazF